MRHHFKRIGATILLIFAVFFASIAVTACACLKKTPLAQNHSCCHEKNDDHFGESKNHCDESPKFESSVETRFSPINDCVCQIESSPYSKSDDPKTFASDFQSAVLPIPQTFKIKPLTQIIITTFVVEIRASNQIRANSPSRAPPLY